MSQKIASLYADIGAKTDNFQKGAANILSGLSKLAISTGTVTAAISLMTQAFEFSKEGAQMQRLADSGAEIARQLGGNMDLIVEKVKAASRGTVSEMDIIASANKAMMLGLGADADQLANLMEIAAFRGRAMGVSTTQAFDDIVRGVGRASPLILDNLGIIVKLGEVNQEYADSVGKTVNELTAAEKKQALLNSVLREGNKLLDAAGGLVDDNASAYEKLQARQQDYMDSLKRDLNNVITPSLEGFLTYAEAMDEVEKQTGRTDQRSKMYLATMKIQTEQARAAKLATSEYGRLVDDVAIVMGSNGTPAMEDYATAIEDAEEAVKAMNAANEEFLSTLGNVASANERYEENIAKLTKERLELEAEKQKLLAQGYSEEHQKIKDIDAALAENSQAAQKNAEEHQLANRKIILGLLERKATQDGVLTDDELNWLLEKGLAWGVYSQTVVDETRKAIDEANLLAETIHMLPTQKEIFIRLMTTGNLGAVGDLIPAGARAGGGSVKGNRPYMVGERGRELFVPESDGQIIPNQNIAGGGNSWVVNITLDSATPDPDRVAYNLKPAIERVVRQMQKGGRL